jgi:ABC-2 type transport system ATP-binding protein
MPITVSELCKSFGDRKVLEHITFDIGKEIFTLLGPNGAGKTTLVNIICGLMKYDSGEVNVCGFDPGTQTQEVRKRIGLVTQETSIYEYLTARENLEFHANFYGVPKSSVKSKVNDALELTQLESRAKDLVGTFSGGMKRRLALVRAMLHDPEVLILDEPTLGIDVQSRNDIWDKILELKERKTVFINTNYMDEADKLSDMCAVIDGGRFIAMDTPENLKTNYSDGVKLTAEIEIGRNEWIPLEAKLKQYSAATAMITELAAGRYRISIPAKKKANALLTEVSGMFNETEGVAIKDLQIRVPTLDDVFLKLTGKKLRD